MSEYKYPETIEDMIAALHYQVADGNAPPELPEILEELLRRVSHLEACMEGRVLKIECVECGHRHFRPLGHVQWQCPRCGKINEAGG